MRKITFLLLHLNYGGLEKQVVTLANELSKKYEVEFLVLYDLLHGKSFYELNKNIKVRFILNYGPIRWNELKNILKSLNIVKFIKYLFLDLKLIFTKYSKIRTITNSLQTDILISSRIEFAAQIKRKDIITISQEHSYIENAKYISKVRKAFNYINYLIVMTEAAKEKYENWFKGYNSYTSVIEIPNVINATEKIASLDSCQIISIGRLEDIKRFDTLIEIFSECLKKNNKLTLKIIGDGSKKEELITLCKNLNISNKVTFSGKLNSDNIEKELLKSAIFVLTSKSESFSLVLVEASSYGVPPLSFDVDVGPREIITNGLNGILVKNDDFNGMQEKILELMDNEKERKNIGKNAKLNAEKYYVENIVKKWEELFH